MQAPLFEVCVDSYASAQAAQAGGGDRLELCANLVIGGTTPSEYLFSQIHRDFTVPVNVLIRPRFGDFLYTDEEFEEMEAQIARFRELGANGVVIGALTADGALDTVRLKPLLRATGEMEVTLHRAFDMAADQRRALEEAIHLGFTTILTSGGMGSALQGGENLATLQKQAAGRIRLMAGAGVNAENIPALHRRTGITAFHGSCRTVTIESAMRFRNPSVNMGLPGLSEYQLFRTDPTEVAKCVQVAHGLAANETDVR